VVEDEEVVLRLARQVLQGAGYTVLCAKDGDEALQVCGESRVDLVISDMVMPGMSGKELIERVKSRHPAVRAMYMSGYGDSVLTQLGVPSSPEGVLRKPFTPEELTRKVREALGG
jgi:CheY-like chemotaxis protein